MTRPPQIVAMGGGGFSWNRKTCCSTASFFPRPQCRSQGLFCRHGERRCSRATATSSMPPSAHSPVPTELSLFKPPTADLRSFVFEQDVIYVGGGNTRNLLALWREWGLDAILREAWLSGIVMAGISAGSICWFQQGLSDSVIPGDLAPLECLGFLPGSNCPHYDGEPERRPAYHRFIQGQTERRIRRRRWRRAALHRSGTERRGEFAGSGQGLLGSAGRIGSRGGCARYGLARFHSADPQSTPESHPRWDSRARTRRKPADPHPAQLPRQAGQASWSKYRNVKRKILAWVGRHRALLDGGVGAGFGGRRGRAWGTLANSCSMRALVPATADS
jgi:dipeptidase E